MRPDNYASYEAVWSGTRFGVGKRGGPAQGSWERQAGGTWKSGIIVLTVKGSRLTGDPIDLTLTRLPDGFSVTGLYFRDNVNLVVTSKGAQAQQFRYVRNEEGAYVSVDAPGNFVLLVGEAARIEDPKWPEIALATVAAGWGVHTGPSIDMPVPPDLTRNTRPDRIS